MTRIVLNGCYGGFHLSETAVEWLSKAAEKQLSACNVEEIPFDDNDDGRTNPLLVKCVEELGSKANGPCSKLYIDEFDEQLYDYWIDEYDGMESLLLFPKIRRSQVAKFLETRDLDGLMNYLKEKKVHVSND